MSRTLPFVVIVTLMVIVPFYWFFVYVPTLVLKVDCPETYTVGELVTLDASASRAVDLKWLIFPETVNFKVDGKKAYFSSSTKKSYTIILMGTNGKVINCKVFNLSNVKPPEPEPGPVPVDPFTVKIKTWLPEKYSKISAIKLAQSFRSVSAISKSSFNDLEAMLLATAYSNRVALEDDLSVWRPFLDNLSKDLVTNPPTSLVDCAARWIKIADALEALTK